MGQPVSRRHTSTNQYCYSLLAPSVVATVPDDFAFAAAASRSAAFFFSLSNQDIAISGKILLPLHQLLRYTCLTKSHELEKIFQTLENSPINVLLDQLLSLSQLGQQIPVHVQVSVHASLANIQCLGKLQVNETSAIRSGNDALLL